jgi:hypothetical protein
MTDRVAGVRQVAQIGKASTSSAFPMGAASNDLHGDEIKDQWHG